MRAIIQKRDGCPALLHPDYMSDEETRLLTHSTMMSEGGPFLWVGLEFHLSFSEVQQLRDYLNIWLEIGQFHRMPEALP